MNYYKHNIGDYRRDTAHLSLLEHGIYRQMLDQYYLDENPLTDDLDKLMRSLCVRTDDEKAAIKNILNDFFDLTKDGYIHKRCETELQKIYDKSEKARESAKRRWLNNQEVTVDDDANALRTHSEGIANGMLPTTHNPLPITHNKTSSDFSNEKVTRNKVPFKSIVDLYHEKLSTLPRVEKLTKAREGYIRQLWLDDLPDMNNWSNFFDYVSKSDFLMGRVPPTNGRRLFMANLEWITKPANFVKILEGAYHGTV